MDLREGRYLGSISHSRRKIVAQRGGGSWKQETPVADM